MASYTKRDGQIPSRFVCIYTLFSSSYLSLIHILSDEPLMAEAPKGGKIVSEQTDDTFGTTTLTLSNGVKVIIKKTDFKADEIRMKGRCV